MRAPALDGKPCRLGIEQLEERALLSVCLQEKLMEFEVDVEGEFSGVTDVHSDFLADYHDHDAYTGTSTAETDVLSIDVVAATTPLVRVGYVIPSNRNPQTDAVLTMQESLLVMQDWYSEQMDRNGFGDKTFWFETEADGVTPLIHVVDVVETDAELRAGDAIDIWDNVLKAAINAGVSAWTPGEVWLLIPEIHVQEPDGEILGGVALGGSRGSGIDPGVAMVSAQSGLVGCGLPTGF